MVLVLDKHKKPLMPTTPKRARLLLACGRAVVHRVKPFVIRLRDRRVEESILQEGRLKLDPGSKNRRKARKVLAKGYLKVQRQREDFARKRASTLVSSHDLIAYEQLQISNMVKNRHMAKSIHDAGWAMFLRWVRYYGRVHGISVIAVEPHFTSQQCSACGRMAKKSLSVRTHICNGCGVVLDRDHNAALNILAKALEGTLGHRETPT